MKPRLFITISFSFSIRYLYRTGLLQAIRSFAHPVIGITWHEPALVQQLQDDGFEVHLIPASKADVYYKDIRRKIDYWFDSFVLHTESKDVQAKYLNQYIPLKQRVKHSVRKKYNVAKLHLPMYKQWVFDREKQMLQKNTNYLQMQELIKKLNIDAVFTVTPFHAQEDILLRACKHLGKKMITSILSFDNLTKRGWIPVAYDTYMVWNKYNQQEAIELYPLSATRGNVHIVGAPQFDFYFNDKYLCDKSAWLRTVGLPATDKKIILYGGGPERLFPNEPQYLNHILEAISKGEIKDDPVILFRCHPIDNIERWKHYLGEHPNLFFDSSWTGKEALQHADITNDDITKLCSTLAYTDVQINLCSTLTVDGSAFKKPQIGPCYDDVNPAKQHLLRNMYYQEHFKPVIATGGLLLAGSRNEMIQHINDALQNPGKYTGKSQEILQEIITYTDGLCTARVANVLQKALAD